VKANGANGVHAPARAAQVLLAEDLRRAYGPRQALRGLSFSLDAGRVLGFLGPNGAGKTTAIRILTTILEPSGGRFLVDGIGSDQPELIRRRIGVLPEHLGFPKHLTGVEYLTYFGQLYGRSTTDARANGLRLLEEVGMQHRGRSLVGSYSRGMQQRLGIARALVNDPIVLFLDEPTLGLDPRGQQELLALIRRIARERHTGVVLCSHLLSEIEGVCDDVVILSAGQVVASGSVADVVGRASQRNAIRVHVPIESAESAERLLVALPSVVSVRPSGQGGGWLIVETKDSPSAATGNDVADKILDALRGAGIRVIGFEAEGGRLQDVFLQLTQEVVR
jgi:ABC-2 type transport system ATP-binding protein